MPSCDAPIIWQDIILGNIVADRCGMNVRENMLSRAARVDQPRQQFGERAGGNGDNPSRI